jgi:hypothetical protein
MLRRPEHRDLQEMIRRKKKYTKKKLCTSALGLLETFG